MLLARQIAETYWAQACGCRRRALAAQAAWLAQEAAPATASGPAAPAPQQPPAAAASQGPSAAAAPHGPPAAAAQGPPAAQVLTGHFTRSALQELRAWAVEQGFLAQLQPGRRLGQRQRSAFKAWCHGAFGDLRTVAAYLKFGWAPEMARPAFEDQRAARAALSERAKVADFPAGCPRAPAEMPPPKAAATARAPDPLAAAAASRRRTLRCAGALRWRLEHQGVQCVCASCGWRGEGVRCLRCEAPRCWWHCAPGTLLCDECHARHGMAPLLPPPSLPGGRSPPAACEAWCGWGFHCAAAAGLRECGVCCRWICRRHSCPDGPPQCAGGCPQPGQHALGPEEVDERKAYSGPLGPYLRQAPVIFEAELAAADAMTLRAARGGRTLAVPGWAPQPDSAMSRMADGGRAPRTHWAQ